MNKNYMMRMMLAGSFAAGMFAVSTAYAVDFNITGFVRQEGALSVTDEENPFNQSGNPFLGKVVPNAPTGAATAPFIFQGVKLNSSAGIIGAATAKGAPYDNGTYQLNQGTAPTAAYFAGVTGRMAGACANANCGNYARQVKDDTPFNLFATRVEIDMQAQWNDSLKTFVKLRAFSDYMETFTDGQIDDHFRTDFGWGGRRGNILEVNSPNFMLDIPAAYLDYNAGSLWVRVGQQQIAWGEAYFFRVFDVPNGLDTRRHFTLDVAAEEFSDKRVASPAVRGSYTFSNGWEVDAFVQMFAPTTIVNTNTPYNIVASGFTWRDNGKFDDAENSLNFGARFNLPLTDKFTMGLMAVNRRNPDGVVTWTDAPTNLPDGTANPFCFGPNNGAAALLSGFGLTNTDTNGNGITDVQELQTPLSGGRCGSDAAPDPMGTASWAEWNTMAGKSRLNPVEGVLGFLNDGARNSSGTNANNLAAANFGLSRPDQIFDVLNGATNVKAPYTTGDAKRTLNAFFNAFGFPRGYITRDFKRETIVGVSGNYIVESEPGSWLDQLIIRGEMTYTPDKRFTPLDLAEGHLIVEDEISSALILEKYHNVFEGIPATYLVAQWMHKTESDLFGRHLSGMDHSFKDDLACYYNQSLDNSTTTKCGRPKGQDSADYVSFAFQQPFPNLIWRADFAMLIDINGGLLLQPGVRYKPSTAWQFDVYANILQDFTPNRNDDVIETLDFADEVFARVSFYF